VDSCLEVWDNSYSSKAVWEGPIVVRRRHGHWDKPAQTWRQEADKVRMDSYRHKDNKDCIVVAKAGC